MRRICLALYLIEILHQTTTFGRHFPSNDSCILSKFYIKPQLTRIRPYSAIVVSYRNSTSNHNRLGRTSALPIVVSYRNSTSNHNKRSVTHSAATVVSYRNSTSNHNSPTTSHFAVLLYLIEILHQTTTTEDSFLFCYSCILSKFYIKPQQLPCVLIDLLCCILSKFYIKPQRC